MSYRISKALLILGELNNDDLNWISRVGKKEILPPGKTLIYKGQKINALYLVLKGILSVFLGEKELARIGKGEAVGEISFIDERSPLATVKAREESLLFVIPRLQLTSKLEHDTGFASRFYHGISLCLADRMRGTVGRLGYGFELAQPEQIELDKLSLTTLEHLKLAQAKFNWLKNCDASVTLA